MSNDPQKSTDTFKELKQPSVLEPEVLKFWKDNDIFEQGLRLSADRPPFVFYEGPPTANGTPHNGHVLTRAIKDLIPRYKTMRGYRVERKAGWDTHGLPVEVEVEKSLGIHGKAAIEAHGVDKFNRLCRESVFKYTKEWEELTERIGFWVNLEEAYVTYHRSYVESVWWALSELFNKGLLYQGKKVVWWWPQGGTALSAGEVGMGYKTVDDPSVVVRFAVDGMENTSFLIWTTTPWTLPSNTAIAVNQSLDYAFIENAGETLIVAAAYADDYDGEVKKVVKGSELVGLRYQPIYDFGKPDGGDSFVVIPGDHVRLGTGTGLVHTAPAFGEDDDLVAKKHGIGMLQMVAPDGTFLPECGFIAGIFCKTADKEIIRDLKERGVLYKQETVRHEYPFCWRSDQDPLIQYARPAWFIRTTAMNKEALANNDAVRWLPEHIKEGRFGDFLRNNVDWALSRERFWGTPLNIWECDSCDHRYAPASTEEIERLAPGALDPSVDRDLQVHRPWIDGVKLPCSVCGASMTRVPEVIDCWFDSGCMPFAQWGFPHKGADEFKRSFPADFISEAVDQTRGWFYSLLMVSTLLFDDETCEKLEIPNPGMPRPYKQCIVLGHVCDMDGKKESKSKGNYTPPDLVISGKMYQNVVPDSSLVSGQIGVKKELVRGLGFTRGEKLTAKGVKGELPLSVVAAKVKAKDSVHMHPDDIKSVGVDGKLELVAPFQAPGADAFRWLFYASNPPWSNTRLSLRAIREGQREFLMRLGNVHSFFSIYANIAGFDPTDKPINPPSGRHDLDRWILHEFTALNVRVVERMDALHLYEAARDIQQFVEGLSNWYVRRSRRRFWGEGDDANDALWTLYEVLVGLSKIIAPFVPFTAEAMYLSLVGGVVDGSNESVHHCLYPTPNEALLDEKLARGMAITRELSSLGLAARSKVGVRVRQPLEAVEVVLADASLQGLIGNLSELLVEELNVREVRFSENAEEFVEFTVKPNFKTLGKRLGKEMKLCASKIREMPGTDVRRAVLTGGLTISLPSGDVMLDENDIILEVHPKGDFQAAGSADAVVALSTEISDDLKEEGLSREVVNRIQGIRKELSLDYTDRISLAIGGDSEVVRAAERFKDHVCKETLTVEWSVVEAGAAGVVALKVDDLNLLLKIERVEA